MKNKIEISLTVYMVNITAKEMNAKLHLFLISGSIVYITAFKKRSKENILIKYIHNLHLDFDISV